MAAVVKEPVKETPVVAPAAGMVAVIARTISAWKDAVNANVDPAAAVMEKVPPAPVATSGQTSQKAPEALNAPAATVRARDGPTVPRALEP